MIIENIVENALDIVSMKHACLLSQETKTFYEAVKELEEQAEIAIRAI